MIDRLNDRRIFTLTGYDIRRIARERFNGMGLTGSQLTIVGKYIYREGLDWRDVVEDVIKKHIVKSEDNRDM